MKTCPKCSVKIGGQFQYCPLCQNELTGEGTECYFPPVRQLRKKSVIYRMQLFTGLTAVIICLFLDFMIGLHGRIHWSIITASTVAVVEMVVRRMIRKQSASVHYYIYHISFASSVVLLVFSYYLDFMRFSISFIFPSLLIMLVGTMFAFGLTDKSGNVMVYLITAICCGIIIPALVLWIITPEFRLLWQICLMLTSVVLTGTLVFKGSRVLNELHKRFHM